MWKSYAVGLESPDTLKGPLPGLIAFRVGRIIGPMHVFGYVGRPQLHVYQTEAKSFMGLLWHRWEWKEHPSLSFDTLYILCMERGGPIHSVNPGPATTTITQALIILHKHISRFRASRKIHTTGSCKIIHARLNCPSLLLPTHLGSQGKANQP